METPRDAAGRAAGRRERGLVRFQLTGLDGVFVIDLERREDHRGYFARAFCGTEFDAHGLNPVVAQANVARSTHKGTVRGMHFQYPPHAEAKLVRATRGTILDVAVDLRPESPTYLRHVAVELTADDQRALYVPERFAHGYQTLEDGTDVLYLTSVPYAPDFDAGLSPFDPRLGISWPLRATEVSAKDAGARPLSEIGDELKRRMAM
jgi:dTDP-4-dehydrorhamnose 3,5-epimerase